jgi:hypothetical protein
MRLWLLLLISPLHNTLHCMRVYAQVEGVVTTSVVDCASLSGLTVYAVSAVLVYLYIIGIPQVTRHLAELSLRGFSAGGSALQSFNQAKYVAADSISTQRVHNCVCYTVIACGVCSVLA